MFSPFYFSFTFQEIRFQQNDRFEQSIVRWFEGPWRIVLAKQPHQNHPEKLFCESGIIDNFVSFLTYPFFANADTKNHFLVLTVGTTDSINFRNISCNFLTELFIEMFQGLNEIKKL